MSDLISNKIKNMSIVCAMLVLFIHVGKPSILGCSGWWLYQFTAEGICRIAVPFFCICSGFLLARHFGEKGWYRSQVGKRIKTLIVPYLLWSLFFYLFVYVLFMISPDNPACWKMKASSSLVAHILMASGFSLEKLPMLYPLWYLRFLVVFVLISPIFCVGNKFVKFAMFVGMGILYILFNPGDVSPIGLHIGFPFEAVFYFYCGILLRDSRIKCVLVKVYDKYAVVIWVAWAFCIVLRTVLLRFGYIGSFFCFLKPLLVFVGVLAVWAVIPSKIWPKKLVSLSFLVYVTHVFGLQLFSFIFGRDSNSALILLGRVTFGLCFALLVSYFLRNIIGDKVGFLWGYRR